MSEQYGPNNPAPGTRLWRLRNYPETMTKEDALALAKDLDRLVTDQADHEHRWRTECEVCGIPGQVHLSLVPR
jgi:hypothetical protein